MGKVKVFYPSGQYALEVEIEALENKALEKTKQLEQLKKETLVLCPKCNLATKISELEGTAHMYYVDNVYTGYYDVSEYSYICPNCNARIRDYDSPELKSLRDYYGKTNREERG